VVADQHGRQPWHYAMLFFHLRHRFGNFASHSASYGVSINDLGGHGFCLPFSTIIFYFSGQVISPASVGSSCALMLWHTVIRYEPNTSQPFRPVTSGTFAALFVNELRQLFYKTASP
jgi:hypothetical protein